MPRFVSFNLPSVTHTWLHSIFKAYPPRGYATCWVEIGCLLILLQAFFLSTRAVAHDSTDPASQGQASPSNKSVVLHTLTEEEKAWLHDNASRMELWYNPDFPPIESMNENGTFAGVGADVIGLVEQRLGVTFPKQNYENRKVYLKALEAGTCAIAPTIVETETRKKYAFFTSPYAQIPVVIIGTPSLGQNLSLDDLKNHRVAIINGHAMEEYIRERAEERFKIVTVDNIEEGLRQVAFGRADAFLENIAVSSYYISKNGITNLQICGETDYTFPFRIAVSYKYPELYSAIQKALDSISSHELDTILHRWIALRPKRGLTPQTLQLLIVIGTFIVLLILGLCIISFLLKSRLNEQIQRLKEAQKDVEINAARYRELFYHAPVAMVDFTLKGNDFNINEGIGRELGYTLADIPDLDSWFQIAYPDPEYRRECRLMWEQDFVSAVKNNRQHIQTREYHIRCKDGTIKTFLVGGSVIGDRLIAFFVDIDKRKRMETELEASRKQFATLFEMAPFPCAIQNFEGRYVKVNQRYCEIVEMTKEEVLGRTPKELGLLIHNDETDDITERTRRTGILPLYEMDFFKGERRISTILANRVIEWEGEKAILTASVEITARKEAEEKLRASEEKFSKVYESAPSAIAITRLNDGLMIDVNKGFEDATGWKREELISLTSADMKFWVNPSARAKMVDALKSTGEVSLCPLRFRRKDGVERLGHYSARIITFSEEEHLIFAMIDTTEQQLAQEALKQEKTNLQTTLDSIGDAVIATDTDGRITRMNPIAEKLTGWSAAEAKGKQLLNVLNIINADTREPIEDPAPRVLKAGDIVTIPSDTILIARNGVEYRIADSASPIKTDEGDLLGIVLVFHDVTQEYMLEEQLRQSHKMKAVGQLAGGVAHDFNNMLSAIIGYAEFLSDSFEEGSEEKRFVERILEASTRASELTRKLLLFSRNEAFKFCTIDIHQPIRSALDLLKHTIDPRIHLNVSLSQESIEIKGDQTMLQNAVLNILINATHAMPNGGDLYVSTRRALLDEISCKIMGFVIPPGHYAELEIRDTGCGISTENLTHIFEPFFTTKEQGKGTGLGLSAVFGTIKQHGGAITVYSEVENGSCFRILLPTTDESVVEENTPQYEPVEGKGHILVVDDEPALRQIAGRVLSKLGYNVVLAENGLQALELFKAAQEPFDLVILDMTMPEMNGRDCFYALRELQSDVRVLLSSGFARHEDLDPLRQDGLCGFIQKPFQRAELNKAVQTALTA